MKELPKKWCIDVSDFEIGKKVVKAMKQPEWYLKNPKEVVYFNFIDTEFHFWTPIERNNLEYTLISFEDFQIHVLKQTPFKTTPEDLSYLIDLFKQQQIT